jgi:hypothetical protein
MFFLPMLFCGVYVLVTLEHFFNNVFCKTVLVKFTTPCQGVVWFVPFQVWQSLHWLFGGTQKHTL